MSAEFFLDTNVFVYHLDSTDTAKRTIAERIVSKALAARNGCISCQIVQECLNVALRKAEVALSLDAARSCLDAVLLPLMQVSATDALYHRALDVRARWRFGFHDSLVVAGALSAGCRTLLSEDMQHGQRLDGLTIVNPFR
jgi:predicted nucleic acid-binding protein